MPFTYIEVDRLEPPVARIRYRGAFYYFNFERLPDAFEHHRGPQVVFPTTSPPVLGGIDVPAAFRPKRGARLALPLYDRPAEGARVVVTVTSTHYLDTMGIGEGTLLASVYRRSNRWSLVRFIDGRLGWLAPADAGKYMSLERLVGNSEHTYMTGGWDGKLAPSPGSAELFELPPDPRSRWIGWLYPASSRPAPVPVYPKPDRAEKALGIVDVDKDYDKVVRLHTSAGAFPPVVFSQADGWIEIGIDPHSCYRVEGTPRAWIEDVAGRWKVRRAHPLEAAIAWAQTLSASGSAARVVETKRIDGVLWLRVKVLLGEACERSLCDVPETVIGEGWVRAHDQHGRSIVWFETYCD